ncbi:peptidase M16 domain protein [Cyanobacterium stanieri PCC 7202]|uniref:Peptidase M16 domain protein n=1 Tax=Cyanobacterium stanieri (strain ATCC 29140 / PCC 7202) TaxID=292563 RepID=K9YJA3_CYASC|nr:peptidase M16 domain protein [Cyanobacterium stanieri PCC 7202]
MKSNHKHIQQTTLNNGITLVVTENPTTEIIAGRIFCRNAGSRWESPEKAGIFHLLANVMAKGTRNLSSLEIAEKVETIGAALGTDTSTDYFLTSIKTVTDDFEPILELGAEMLRYPSFPETELELEKNITLQNILSQKEQPFNLAFNQLRQMMYGQHPYGFSILGTEESVNKITLEDLKACHQRHFRPDNIVISLAGKIDLEQAILMVNKIFGDWKNPAHSMDSLTTPVIEAKSAYGKIDQQTQQSIIMMGYITPSMDSVDYPVLKLISTYLGNGLSSRLFVELREKRGLAYDVSAFYPTRLDKSQFVVYMGTAPVNATIGMEGLQAEISRLREVTLTEEELQTAKNKLLGQYALGKQTNSEFAQIFGWYETLGVGIDYDRTFQDNINSVTVAQVQEVANKYLQDEFLCTSIVGPN